MSHLLRCGKFCEVKPQPSLAKKDNANIPIYELVPWREPWVVYRGEVDRVGKLITTLRLHKSFNVPAFQQPAPLIFSLLALTLTADVTGYVLQVGSYI